MAVHHTLCPQVYTLAHNWGAMRSQHRALDIVSVRGVLGRREQRLVLVVIDLCHRSVMLNKVGYPNNYFWSCRYLLANSYSYPGQTLSFKRPQSSRITCQRHTTNYRHRITIFPFPISRKLSSEELIPSTWSRTQARRAFHSCRSVEVEVQVNAFE